MTAPRSESANDPGRFARALALALRPGAVTQVGPQQFRIVGNDEPEYFVDLSVDPPCYCGDMAHRAAKIRNNCKHTLAARLAVKDPTIMTTLMEYAYAAEQRKAS